MSLAPYADATARRAKREADNAIERARNPHEAVITCDACSAAHVIPDAEKYRDADLAVAFYRAGWHLGRKTLCPEHKATSAAVTAARARVQR